MTFHVPDQLEDTHALLRSKVESLKSDGRVPLYVAEDFVRASAWWLTHRYGPVRAPGYADRLTMHPNYGWQLKLGSNAFLVEHAIGICARLILEYLDKTSRGEEQPFSQLRLMLQMAPRWAVANHAGYRFRKPYQLEDGDPEQIRFGGAAIDLEDFANHVLYYVPVESLSEENREETEYSFDFGELDLSLLDDELDEW